MQVRQEHTVYEHAAQEHMAHEHESLRFLHFELSEFRKPRHRHRQLELTWIERGAGLRLVGDKAEAFGAGDLVLIGPDLPHTWLSEPDEQCPLLRASVVQFLPERLPSLGWPELQSTRAVLQAAARGLHIGGATHRRVTGALEAMKGLSALGRLAAWLDILDALASGGNDLRPICDAAAHRAPRPQSRGIAQVLDWIQGQLHRSLPLAEASRLAKVSEAAFSRYFRHEVGKTFTAYVNDLRCAQACVLLRQTGLPVAVIAGRCGFGASSNFNRQFLRRMGRSPQAYRARAGAPGP